MANPTINQPGFVYVIHAIGTNRIKVGYSISPKDRLAQLQTGSPYSLQLLAAWPGSEARERRVHRHLSQFRQIGEWFEVPPFAGMQIYELVTKGKITASIAASSAAAPRMAAPSRIKIAIPVGIDRRAENGAVVLYRRVSTVSPNGKRSSRRTYLGRISAKEVAALRTLSRADQLQAVADRIESYEQRKTTTKPAA